MIDDNIYIFELDRWIDRLNQYMETMKQEINKKKELGAVFHTLR
jgi:hypothetical protein